MTEIEARGRFRGCLLAGAVGDALGAPIEFLSLDAIRRRFGPRGIQEYAEAYGRRGAITDDTQMTLFTAEGLIRAYVRWCGRGMCSVPGVVSHAYRRWLVTQDGPGAAKDNELDGWLTEVSALHSRRAPGNTCLAALRGLGSFGDPANNSSKGCGGVMRVAPVGMFLAGAQLSKSGASLNIPAFELGVELAALTHGHPTGQLASGLFADVIARVLLGSPLPEAVRLGLEELRRHPHHEETSELVEHALKLAESDQGSEFIPASLGQGWVAEEALAMSLYCALVAPDLESGLRLAVNHGGDSDSTGSIAGNLLGAILGETAIPRRWLQELELRDEIAQMADDLLDVWSWDIDGADSSEVHERYPGW